MSDSPAELEDELKKLIIDKCNITDVEPDEVGYDDPLFGPDSPLGLDSLDAVEVVVAVQKAYDVQIGNQKKSREVLASLRTLANFLREKNGLA